MTPLGCCCFAAVVEILNIGAPAMSLIQLLAENVFRLEWNTRYSSSKLKRFADLLPVCFGWCPHCWKTDRVQTWGLGFWFITALRGKDKCTDWQGDVRGQYLVRTVSRMTQRRGKRLADPTHNCLRSVNPVAMWKLWLSLTSLLGGRLDRNLL